MPEPNLDGSVHIRDNRILVTPPLPGGRPAVITAVHPVVLSINGRRISGSAPVLPEDVVSWEISEKPQYEITMPEDRLHVYFTLYRAERYAWKLVDCSAARELRVRAEPDRSSLLSTLTVEQVLAGLGQSSLTRNVSIPALYAELSNPTYQPVCIARGKAPVPGRDAQLQLIFRARTTGPDDEATELPGIAIVREGQTIARKVDAQDGLPGYDVFGSVLPAPRPADLRFTATADTKVLPGGEVVALRDGRPRITGNGTLERTFDLAKRYVLPESLPPGASIVFGGDVVASQCLSGVTIEAIGNVYVFGDVYHCTLAVTGSIYVQGRVVDSRLYAGSCGVVRCRMWQKANLLLEELGRLREAAQELAEAILARQETVRYGLVTVLMLEGKFKHVPPLAAVILETLGDISGSCRIKEDTSLLEKGLERLLQPWQHIDTFSDDEFNSLIERLRLVLDYISYMQEEGTRIEIGEAESSVIESAGGFLAHHGNLRLSELLTAADVPFLLEDTAT
ncbi:flagellar assembly protein A [Paenibacillus sp. NFR01]|uniref:flagellar assembly protein A n=1 Tax=Paenibacillus sp. NFR01 TaxID=1566279 RepID=UPI001587A966|nr:flagellar assembly protein A [Paenibacillus sp. NFR01]